MLKKGFKATNLGRIDFYEKTTARWRMYWSASKQILVGCFHFKQ